jgi:UDP-2,3-diacylglucosamine pyrophosphatase LpxH
MTRFLWLGAALLAVGISCRASAADHPGRPEFSHDVTGAVRPWTEARFDASPEKFTFAVLSDLTGGERPRVFDIAIAQLALLRPELVLSVGDLVEGADTREEIAGQRDAFDQRAARSRSPVFYVGGNHDLTGSLMQQTWDQRYGRRYYHFRYKNVLFLVLDTEDTTPARTEQIARLRKRAMEVVREKGWGGFDETEYARQPENDAGAVSPEQSHYFRQVIADNPDVRWTFLFMHKAAWERRNEQNFAAIETALADRPYTVFHGHKHAYRYLQRYGRDYIRLATTGGVPLPGNGRSFDQVTLVTVGESDVDIVNLALSGILDKTGHVPLGGDDVCFEQAVCGAPAAD